MCENAYKSPVINQLFISSQHFCHLLTAPKFTSSPSCKDSVSKHVQITSYQPVIHQFSAFSHLLIAPEFTSSMSCKDSARTKKTHTNHKFLTSYSSALIISVIYWQLQNLPLPRHARISRDKRLKKLIYSINSKTYQIFISIIRAPLTFLYRRLPLNDK